MRQSVAVLCVLFVHIAHMPKLDFESEMMYSTRNCIANQQRLMWLKWGWTQNVCALNVCAGLACAYRASFLW